MAIVIFDLGCSDTTEADVGTTANGLRPISLSAYLTFARPVRLLHSLSRGCTLDTLEPGRTLPLLSSGTNPASGASVGRLLDIVGVAAE